MIVLHVVLILLALRGSERSKAKLAQAVIDYMAADLDRSIRELGVGDLSVSRFMKRLGEGLYGRAAAYEGGLRDQTGDDLPQALLRNVYAGIDPGDGILSSLSGYTHHQLKHLSAFPFDKLEAGDINFLQPSALPARR